MSLVFKPGLWRASSTSPPSLGDVIGSGRMFWLPLPVTSFPVGTEWKGEFVEPVMKDGSEGVRGNYKSSRVESFSGLLAKTKTDGTVLLSEGDMFQWFEALNSFVSSGDNAMELFWFYDSGTSTYRKYKGVYAHACKTNLGDQNRLTFPWDLQLKLTDPAIYTTAPGA